MDTTRTIAGMIAAVAFALGGLPAHAELYVSPSAAYEQETIPAFVLENGEEIEDLEGYAGTGYYFQFTIPEGTRELEIESDGDGDVDLYLAQGWMPEQGGYQYAAAGRGADEKIKIAWPRSGTWYLLAFGQRDFDDLEIEAKWKAPKPVVIHRSSPGIVFYGSFGLSRLRRAISICRTPSLYRWGRHHKSRNYGSHHSGFHHRTSTILTRPGTTVYVPPRRTIAVPRVSRPATTHRPTVGSSSHRRPTATYTPRSTLGSSSHRRPPSTYHRRPTAQPYTPRASAPRVVSPHASRPNARWSSSSRSRVTPPQYSRPRVTTPRVSRPRVVTPQASRSRVTTPQHSRSRVTPPQYSRSRVAQPPSSRTQTTRSTTTSRTRSTYSRRRR